MVMLDLMTKAERMKDYSVDETKATDGYAFDEIKLEEEYSSGDILNGEKNSSDEIIVAHFDHGIRGNSGEDAEFVRRMAEEIYHAKYIEKKGKLTEATSEETARTARYEFLHEVVRENEPAMIYTAHHLDDLIETVAINLIRGTGWRGLAGLDTVGVRRPLLEAEICYEPMDKLAILEYAAKRRLRFREDQTNSSEKYLRNRVRARLEEENWSYERKLEMWELWQKQKKLRREIDQLVVSLLPKEGESWQRKWFRELEENVALELLRSGLLRVGVRATRPQIEDFRQAILNYAPGKYFNLPEGRLVRLGKTEFWLEKNGENDEKNRENGENLCTAR